ncbi:DUF222 domain-containing protein [Streptomyces sp. NA04227]|nr:DUF222 domain-containing protein [Streptomyces sp. NA04227]
MDMLAAIAAHTEEHTPPASTATPTDTCEDSGSPGDAAPDGQPGPVATPVRTFDEELLGDWQFAAEEVACALRLANNTASDRLQTARQLDSKFPTTMNLLGRGEISYLQAKAVADVCETLDPQVAEQVEASVAPKMPFQPAGRTRAALRRAIHQVDPRGAEERHRRRKQERETVCYPREDGMALFGAVLPAEQTARMEAAVDEHAAQLAEDGRSLPQRRADALYDLVVHRGTTAARALQPIRALLNPQGSTPGSDPTSSAATPANSTAMALPTKLTASAATTATGDKSPALWTPDAAVEAVLNGPVPTTDPVRRRSGRSRGMAVVQVTVPLDVLIGADDGPADLTGYGPITAEQARAIAFAPGTVWRRLITHPETGLLIKSDPTTYRPTAETARHVIARDGCCAFPSCRVPAYRCDLDHIEPFHHRSPDHGGKTVPDNLQPLCRRHHRLKTHHGWKVTRDSRTGIATWTSPVGHRYTNKPVAYGRSHGGNRPTS